MPIFKREYASGKIAWFYQFDAPGSTRIARRMIKQGGFATRKAAIEAEAARRIAEQRRGALGLIDGDAVDTGTLAGLLREFFRQHAVEKLAPKTVERYRDLAGYLAPELLAMPLADITPLHLSREWMRLLKSGGHARGTGTPRALSAKTVRHVAGVVSSAFGRAVRWGLLATNPAATSEPPVPQSRRGMALTPAQQALLIGAATGPWCLGMFLELAAATGARRGELLALRWSDIQEGRIVFTRSLCQTRQGLAFKSTKTEEPRDVTLPASTLVLLEAHRKRQDEYRRQFGPTYQAGDLVIAEPDGAPLRPDSISAAVSALVRRLKLPRGVSLHTLRHTHGSHLLAAGTPLPAVSARLGHSSVRVTADVYSHAIAGQDDEAARRWEAYQARGRREAIPRIPQ